MEKRGLQFYSILVHQIWETSQQGVIYVFDHSLLNPSDSTEEK
jgi:hypothetical protein